MTPNDSHNLTRLFSQPEAESLFNLLDELDATEFASLRQSDASPHCVQLRVAFIQEIRDTFASYKEDQNA
jgi:hypothetical protein